MATNKNSLQKQLLSFGKIITLKTKLKNTSKIIHFSIFPRKSLNRH